MNQNTENLWDEEFFKIKSLLGSLIYLANSLLWKRHLLRKYGTEIFEEIVACNRRKSKPKRSVFTVYKTVVYYITFRFIYIISHLPTLAAMSRALPVNQ